MLKFTITVNIYKYNLFKLQEQVLLNASTQAEAKQKAMLIPNSTRWAMDLTPRPDLRTIKRCSSLPFFIRKSISLHVVVFIK